MEALATTATASLPAMSSVVDWVVEHRALVAAPAVLALLWAFRRPEDRVSGLGALVAAVALGVVLILRVERESTIQPRNLVVVSSEPLDLELRSQLDLGMEDARSSSRRPIRVREHVERDRPPGEALAAGSLLAGADAELLFVWNRSSPSGPPLRSSLESAGFSRSGLLDFDPSDCSVRPVARPVVGRPVDLEVVLPPAAIGEGAKLRWSESEDFLEPATPIRLEWTPAEAGAAELWVDWIRDGTRVRWRLSVDVAESSRRIQVLGDPGGRLASALTAQGLRPTEIASLEAFESSEDDPGWFLIGRRLQPEEQDRLRSLIDRGAGVFLLELGDGALPFVGEPLADWSPFTPKPRPESEREDSAGEGETEAPENPDDPGEPEQLGDPDPPEAPEESSDSDPMDPETSSEAESEGAASEEPELPEFDPIFGDTSDADPSTTTEAEVERRSVSLLLLIDQSESMLAPVSNARGRRMISFARSAARQTALQLQEGDELGIVGFSGTTHEHLPLGPLPSPGEIERVLAAIRPGGGTNLPKAVNYAVRELLLRQRGVRHAVILTDAAGIGRPNLGPTQAIGFASQLAEAGGGVSLILIGDRNKIESRDLRVGVQIAERGGGQLVVTDDGRQIPTLILAEVRRVLGVAAQSPEGPEVESPGEGPGVVDPSGSGVSEAGEGNDESADPATSESETPEPSDPEAVDPGLEESSADIAEPSAPDEVEQAAGPAVEELAPSLQVLPIAPSPLVDPFVAEPLPMLTTVAAVEGRSESDQLLAVFPEGRPLLAFVNRGLGRLGGFSAPFNEVWWDDPRLPAMLATWVQATAPAARSESRSDVVSTVEILPGQPIGAERRSLQAAFPEGLPPLEKFELGPSGEARSHTTERSLVPDDALWALLGFLFLVLVERFARRDR